MSRSASDGGGISMSSSSETIAAGPFDMVQSSFSVSFV